MTHAQATRTRKLTFTVEIEQSAIGVLPTPAEMQTRIAAAINAARVPGNVTVTSTGPARWSRDADLRRNLIAPTRREVARRSSAR